MPLGEKWPTGFVDTSIVKSGDQSGAKLSFSSPQIDILCGVTGFEPSEVFTVLGWLVVESGACSSQICGEQHQRRTIGEPRGVEGRGGDARTLIATNARRQGVKGRFVLVAPRLQARDVAGDKRRSHWVAAASRRADAMSICGTASGGPEYGSRVGQADRVWRKPLRRPSPKE